MNINRLEALVSEAQQMVIDLQAELRMQRQALETFEPYRTK